MDTQLRTYLNGLKSELITQRALADTLLQVVRSWPRSGCEEIDQIPGRRVIYHYVDTQSFTVAANNGLRGNALVFNVSQDGPFVMTHYPLVMWRPNVATTATDYGMWRPISSWPLPDQIDDDNTIDISYEMSDSGSQRNLQNAAAPAGLISRPDHAIRLGKPMLFAPKVTISFTPTYEDINFSDVGGQGEAPTGGLLVVVLIGYRIVNL